MRKQFIKSLIIGGMLTASIIPISASCEKLSAAEIHKNAYEMTMKAMEAKTQKSINEARQALAELNSVVENHHGISTWSTMLDSVQHPIFVEIVDRILLGNEMVKNGEKVSQQFVNELRILMENDINDKTDDIPREYFDGPNYGWSEQTDKIQQSILTRVENSVIKAETDKTTESVNLALDGVNELKTAVRPEIVEFAKKLEKRVKAITPVNKIKFADMNLEKVIREALGKSTGEITAEDCLSIKTLNASGKGIKNLSGIENLVNLEVLDLGDALNEMGLSDYNYIEDISSLANLTKLKELNLSCNSVENIHAIENLKSLETLNIGLNNISDISALKNLINIKNLNFNSNNVSDISVLTNLTKLEVIQMEYNPIKNIKALENLKNITGLFLPDLEKGTDISFLKLYEKLKKLSLGYSELNSEQIEVIKSLQTLKVLYVSVEENVLNELTLALPNCFILND